MRTFRSIPSFIPRVGRALLVATLLVSCLFVAKSNARGSDNDLDGIDDAYEYYLADRFRPYMHFPGDNACLDVDGVEKYIFRLRHPTYDGGIQDPNIIAINYVHLYRQDCGPWSWLIFLRMQSAPLRGSTQDSYLQTRNYRLH